MATFRELYQSLDVDSLKRGKQFERFAKWFLKNAPEWSTQVDQVWLWEEYLAALSAVFSTAVKPLHWIEDSPMRRVEKPSESKGRTRFLNDDERAKLLDACQKSSNNQLHVCVVLALSTGTHTFLSLT